MTEPLFRGVGVALVTLFNDDGSLDAKQSADLAARLVEAGVTSVIIAGSTGEAAALEPFERAELVHAVRAAIPAGIPILAGIGAPSTRQALEHLGASLEAGADGLLALSLPGGADQLAYYETLASASGEVPLLAYHFPAMSAPGIPLPLLRSLPVDGVKDSSGDPDRLLDTLTTFHQPLYTGAAALLSLAGPLGVTGAILALANAQPEDCVAAFGGDHEAQLRLAEGNRRAKANFPSGIKELTAERYGTSTVARMG